MTDPRPSENDDIPQWPGFRAAGWMDQPAPVEDVDALTDLIEKADNAHDPEHGLVFAQLATTRAVMENTTQLRAIAQALNTLVVIFDGGTR